MQPSDEQGPATEPVATRESTPHESSTPDSSHASPASLASDMDMDGASRETRLNALIADARNQDEIERNIGRQAEAMLTTQANERDQKRLEKAEAAVKQAQVAISKLRNRLAMPRVESEKLKIRAEIAKQQKKIEDLDKEQDAVQQRINDRNKAQYGEEDASEGVSKQLPNESRRDFLIRTGKITPFSKIAQTNPSGSTLADALLNAEVEEEALEDTMDDATHGPTSHVNLMKPGFRRTLSNSSTSSAAQAVGPAKKKRRLVLPAGRAAAIASDASDTANSPTAAESDDAYTPDMTDRQLAALGESDATSPEVVSDDEYEQEHVGRKRKVAPKKASKKSKIVQAEQEDFTGIDDGNEKVYRNRLREWTEDRSAARRHAREKQGIGEEEGDEPEWEKPHPTQPNHVFEGGLSIPGDIYQALFDYQKTGVGWLGELHDRNVGGILADEMGLGKTIQTISFVAGLHHSGKLTKPVLIVCPATVMKQWVKEFHQWWPALRISILHSSGSGMLDGRREDRIELEAELRGYGEYDETLTTTGKAAKNIIEKVKREGHVLVTTYAGLQTYSEFLLPTEWEAAILDEGHKIRNPNTAITQSAKQLQTHNRIILSGTPMQNNLVELWSLFDFVFPMRLGTLIDFRRNFEFPIKRGGYANASNLEFETAQQVAQTLKDAISPYMLQRYKADVATDLPQKTEQVLFCKLVRQQREAYEGFLNSDELKSILAGKRQSLYGIDYLRKICNHPDLLKHKTNANEPDYGQARLSGKMQVVKDLLQMWKEEGHKTLLFAQHRIMLDILEKFIKRLPGIRYMRMDGSTDIKRRQDMVDEFNNNPNIHVFLLTTKVGGLGVNLTGADRVIIYDPDWNPSTDTQARERSWRLGQKRDVVIYRLLTRGTIEEKIFHRQVFKQYLTNKVLKDPKGRQTLQMSDMHDLFTLGGDIPEDQTETGNIFRDAEVHYEPGDTPLPPADNLSNIFGIDYVQTHNPDPEGDASAEISDGADVKAKSDGRLLGTIFAKSGVSVMEHDAIVNSTTTGRKRKVLSDPTYVVREAKRAAAAAAEELKRAEEEARNAPIGVPTWTGEYGEAGRPASPPPARGGFAAGRGGRGGAAGRGGPSSSSVLNNLAARQGRANGMTPSHSRASTPSSTGGRSRPIWPGGAHLMQDTRNFIRTHDNSVPTEMLQNHFERRLRRERVEPETFKELLRLLAKYEKASSAQHGRWVLKPEYRATAPSAGPAGPSSTRGVSANPYGRR